MYNPKFNSVLVEIDDKDAEWGGENNSEMLGKSYSKGKVISIGLLIPTQAYPFESLSDTHYDCVASFDVAFLNEVETCIGQDIMWNEGTEAGTTFEHDGKLYGFIYWFDIRGVKQ